MAALDKAKHGITFSSGLGGTTALTHLLNSGDHIVAMDDLYGGTNRYFRKVAKPQMNIDTTFVDMAADPLNAVNAMTPKTKMICCSSLTDQNRRNKG